MRDLKNPHGMCISSWKSMNLRANVWEIYIVSNASQAILGHANKKNAWVARVRTQLNIFLALTLWKKKQKLPTKDKVQKTPKQQNLCIFKLHISSMVGEQSGRQDWRSSMRSSNLGGFQMPGVNPTGFFFRRCVLESNLFYKGDFFFETHHKKYDEEQNRLK